MVSYRQLRRADGSVDPVFVALEREDGSGATIVVGSNTQEAQDYEKWLAEGNEPSSPATTQENS